MKNDAFSRKTKPLFWTQMHQIAQLTSGYSGSDLAALARDAAYGPIRWGHLRACTSYIFNCFSLFLLVAAFGLAPAIFLFTLQGAKDRWGEVVGSCKFEEDQHERFPGSNEADKKVRGHIYVLSAKSYKILQVGLSGQPGALRGVEPEVWRGSDLDLNQNLVDYPTSMHLLTLYIYIASLVFQRCWCLSRPPFGPLSHPTKPSSLKNGQIGKLRLVMLAVTCLF